MAIYSEARDQIMIEISKTGQIGLSQGVKADWVVDEFTVEYLRVAKRAIIVGLQVR